MIPALVVPSGAVNYREKEKDNLVYVKKGDKFVPKTVQTGLSSHGEAIILSGVEDGELIALTNPFETRKLYLPDFSKGSTQQGRGRGQECHRRRRHDDDDEGGGGGDSLIPVHWNAYA